METNFMNQCMEKSAGPADMNTMTAAFTELAAANQLNLLDRYESRLHRICQRSLHNLILLRTMDSPDRLNSPESTDPPEARNPQPDSQASPEISVPPNKPNTAALQRRPPATTQPEFEPLYFGIRVLPNESEYRLS
jgi:hypothetical protein